MNLRMHMRYTWRARNTPDSLAGVAQDEPAR